MNRRRRARIALAILGGAMLLALGYTAYVWKQPAPIRIAFANSLTGPTSSPGAEILAAIKLYIDEVNRTGGVSGHPIELVLFDDASSPEVAHANVQKIADSPCVAVLGHFLSTVSLAAGQGYKAARIPALTGASSADTITIDNPYYFRAQTPVSTQGRSSAEYLRHVFKTPVVLLLHSRDNYGLSFLKGFSEGYENDKLIARGFDASRDLRGGSLRATCEAAASDREPGIIINGTAVDNVPEVLKAVRRQGMRTTGDGHRRRGIINPCRNLGERTGGKRTSRLLQREPVRCNAGDLRQRQCRGSGFRGRIRACSRGTRRDR